MIMENKDIRREKAYLWITVVMVILLAIYRLASLLNVRVDHFFMSYTQFPVAEFLSNLLFFWLMGLLWITYHHWRKAVEYNRKLEEILKSISPDSIAVINSARKITMCSGQIESMFGIPAHKLIGQSTDAIYCDQRVLGEKGEIAKRLEKYGFQVGYATGKRANGETFPLEIITGEISGSKDAVLLMRDITEQRKAEEALCESEARFEQFMRYLPGCAFIKDCNGRYLYLNRYHKDVYGWNIADAIGKTDRDLLPPDQAEVIMANNHKVLSTGTEMHYTTRMEKDGRLHSLLTCTFPIDSITTNNKLIGGISLDITAREKAENERRSIERQMLHAQKLESLGVLGGGIAHDFNNLLMGIMGHADIALSEIPEGAPGRRNIEALISSSKQAADLANQLLAYAGKSNIIVENANISSIIKEMTNLLKVSISKNAKLHTNLMENLPAVKCDVTQIRQVIMNLIANASDALCGEPGEITIETGCLTLDEARIAEADFNTSIKPGRYVFTRVGDTGVGMNEETRLHIFDPFFTTKHSGHGLGLAAVLGIIRNHHGTIDITSSPDKGSTFTFYIPALDHTASKRDNSNKVADNWHGDGTVLVADDDETVRKVAGIMLQTIGFRVVEVSNGSDAVAIISADPDRFSAVLLDMTMPDTDGLEAYHAIRKLKPQLPIVLTSGYNKSSEVAKLKDNCPPAFLKKPYRIEQLSAVFRSMLQKPKTGI